MGPEGNKKRSFAGDSSKLFWNTNWKDEAKKAASDIKKHDNMKDVEDEEEIWVDVDFDSDEETYI